MIGHSNQSAPVDELPAVPVHRNHEGTVPGRWPSELLNFLYFPLGQNPSLRYDSAMNHTEWLTQEKSESTFYSAETILKTTPVETFMVALEPPFDPRVKSVFGPTDTVHAKLSKLVGDNYMANVAALQVLLGLLDGKVTRDFAFSKVLPLLLGSCRSLMIAISAIDIAGTESGTVAATAMLKQVERVRQRVLRKLKRRKQSQNKGAYRSNNDGDGNPLGDGNPANRLSTNYSPSRHPRGNHIQTNNNNASSYRDNGIRNFNGSPQFNHGNNNSTQGDTSGQSR